VKLIYIFFPFYYSSSSVFHFVQSMVSEV